MRKKIALLIAGNIFFGGIVCGNEVEVIGIKAGVQKLVIPKDPLIAGLFSVQYPGLGQIYCRRYLRGASFLVGEIGCFILAGAIAGVETKTYNYTVTDEEGKEHKLTQEETVSRWDELSGLEKAGVVSLILGGVGIHIWNIVDAYHLAHKYNEERLGWLQDVDVQFGFKEDSPKILFSKKF